MQPLSERFTDLLQLQASVRAEIQEVKDTHMHWHDFESLLTNL